MYSMRVEKRNGSFEAVSFDKVLKRIRKASKGLQIIPDALAQQILARIINGIKTSELDDLTAQSAASLCTTHPDWGTLASRIAVSNHQKNTTEKFSQAIERLSSQRHISGSSISYISTELADITKKYAEIIDAYIQHDRDYLFDYFGFKTLEKSYLLRDASMKIVERPQHMWMRVSLGIWGDNLPMAFKTYDLLSTKRITHATPTLFNAGTPRAQLSSCYLLAISDDSIAGIYKTLGDCAAISKYAGGIGLHIHNIRARGSLIRGTNGTSNGLMPMLRVFNNTARYVDQGGGRRNGSFAMYLEPWHADVEDFLRMKLNSGAEEERARDLFYALWIPDLFMRRVEANEPWSLFCPDEAPGLSDVHSRAFDTLYESYEARGLARSTVSARKLWFQILETQMETGTPYLLYKDPANSKSNQQNLGTIKSSNLCTEIIEYSSPTETAVCNLASIALPSFIKSDQSFDFDNLRETTKVLVRNLNRIIDINFYPTPETRVSNMRHRPIGIGVQGLADLFAVLDMAWESDEAQILHKRIFEHIYFAAVEESAEIALVEGAYETFSGSPISKGVLQPDMWGIVPTSDLNWEALRLRVKSGVRNSLLIAPMPTASTSQILGFNECFEPFTTNIYTRRTLAGEFIVMNKYLVQELIHIGLWSDAMKQRIIAMNGSVQGISEIPESLRKKYKTAWELPQKLLIDMAADRGAFICQSQSLNLFVADPTNAKLTSMHFYAWKKGLKTGCYYLRTKAPVVAQKFTIDPRLLAAVEGNKHIYNDSEDEEEEDEECMVPTESRAELLEKRARLAAEERAKNREKIVQESTNEDVCTNCSA
jgi:ribonucleoside-diphosphate reductase alpha chain